jgi:hypothetical protein
MARMSSERFEENHFSLLVHHKGGKKDALPLMRPSLFAIVERNCEPDDTDDTIAPRHPF